MNGWIERREKLRSVNGGLMEIVMSSFLELQYAPVFNCKVITMRGDKFSHLREISNSL